MREISYYLVGGCVRDRLLGLPAHDRDWLVVGATPEDLLKQGYRSVGQSFPVFVHPQTGEEYALARLERKTGDGHRDFDCYFSPDVTLEQDLGRRDLTINAMAEDQKGKLYDPYGGFHDLKGRVLRHVSSAFSEDPLRILRVARFMAQLGIFKFEVHPSTLGLMQDMVAEGALRHLSGERIWEEFKKALSSSCAKAFFESLHGCGALQEIVPEVSYCGSPATWPNMLFASTNDLLEQTLLNFASFLWWLSQKSDHSVAISVLAHLSTRLKLPNRYEAIIKRCLLFDDHLSHVKRFDSTEIVEILEQVGLFNRPEVWGYLVPFYEKLKSLGEAFLPPYLIELFKQSRVWMSAEKALSVRLDKKAIAGLSVDEIRQRLKKERLLAYGG